MSNVEVARRLSLRIRLASVAAIGAMVVLTAGALLLYRDLTGELSDAITNELAISVDDLAADYAEDGDVSAGSGLVSTQVVDRNGTVVSPPGAAAILTVEELTRALQRQIIVDRSVPRAGQHARLLARPIGDPDAVLVGVAAISTRPLEDARDRLLVVLAVAGPALAAGLAASAWFMARAALRPVRRMANEAAAISMVEPGHRLPVPAGNDEIAVLGRTLNAMLARIETTVAHERAFIDDAAHELRTPIAVLRGELELAAHDLDDPRLVAEGLASALEETDRLARLSEDLLTLARADAGQLVASDTATDLLDTAQAAVRRIPHRDDVSIEVRGEPIVVRGDEDWIRQIITNLVANANRYARHTIVVAMERAGDHATLVVADDGPGFPEHLLGRAFDRFARGDGARGRTEGGAGLGLAIVASFARALGGTVSARNGAPLAGACVTLQVPVALG